MNDTYTIHPDVEFRRLGEEMVLVHLSTNQVFELNNTGARVWELLESGAHTEEILERLSAEFDVEPEQLRRDVTRLLEELEAAGLIA
jgi:PqqD family protein of HPr-rel-A system